MSGHTPGPWRRGQDGNARVYGPDATEHAGMIAHVYGGDRAGANARLIAAAPELLEALQRIRSGSGYLPSRDMECADAAIAAAEGK